MYKVIGAVIYTIIDNYIFIDCLVILQYKLSKHDNKFEKIKFKNISGLGIPDILMNIMPCHLFSKYSISTASFDMLQFYSSVLYV